MATAITIVQGDTTPDLITTLLDDGVPVDLSGATVEVHLKHKRQGVVIVRDCVLDDAPGGVVRYVWVPGDTDIAGAYSVEFLVTFAPGKVQTFPVDGQATITMKARKT